MYSDTTGRNWIIYTALCLGSVGLALAGYPGLGILLVIAAAYYLFSIVTS